MYVCLCNAISDTELKRLAAEGHRNASKAYGALGAEVCCGRCVPTAEDILNTPQADGVEANPFYRVAAE